MGPKALVPKLERAYVYIESYRTPRWPGGGPRSPLRWSKSMGGWDIKIEVKNVMGTKPPIGHPACRFLPSG